MRLTVAMLDAMLTALCEFEAGGEPQGFDSEEEAQECMVQAQKAMVWIRRELNRREAAKAESR
jgi:hypothetical protein